jgi:DNA invertase Pin-like site-specific DNA recombinase
VLRPPIQRTSRGFAFGYPLAPGGGSDRDAYGYARVSTEDQNLDLQHDALTKAGCEKVFDDKISGVRDDRPGLTDALSHLRAGDCLVVYKLDRLGRTMRGLRCRHRFP